jgi:hypothetical protein
MLRITLEWARLAPLPQNISDFSIRTEGSSFTRTFRSYFHASQEDIIAWVNSSPGLKDATVFTNSNGTQKYVISPGGGACCAEVVIDYQNNLVEIYVAWS